MTINVKPEEWKESVKLTCIYKITNNINGKIYIGQTTDFRKRMSVHKNSGYKNPSEMTGKLALDIRKYGHENFTVDILERCEPEDLDRLEEYYIKTLNACDDEVGYNIDDKKRNANSLESRIKKSLSHTGLKEPGWIKRKKSIPVIATKMDQKIILYCESAKIFGDLIGKKRNIISHAIKQPQICCGWYVYYDDYRRRQTIRRKVERKSKIKNLEYMMTLDILDKYELEGVETIYHDYNVYLVSYEYVSNDGTPYPQPLMDADDYRDLMNPISEDEYTSWS